MTEQECIPNNPAARLYSIASEFADYGSNCNTTDVLAEVFQLAPENRVELFRALMQLFNLINETKQALVQLEGVNKKLYLQPIETIEVSFSKLDLDGYWTDIKRSLNSGVLIGLQFCSDALSGKQGEVVIDREQLMKLQNDVEELLETVVESSLSEELKSFLYEKIQDINRAIHDYRFYGSTGLRRTVESSLGGLLLRQEQVQEQIQEPGKKQIIQSFFSVLRDIDLLLGLSVKAKQLQLGSIIQNFLGSSDN